MLTAAAVKARALECGFDLVGIAVAARHARLARLAEWIREGRSGEMTYLGRTLDERLDPARVLASARSAISLGVIYNTDQAYSTEVVTPGRALVARYAWGDDYHEILRRRLTTLVTWMSDQAGEGLEAFSSVDTGPVQERVFAEQAGLGWIGKNTCLINARRGSWLFLAVILTNAELDPDEPGVDRCGTCTACLDACPTDAITEPYTLDATRCLSYMTIEQRGEVEKHWRDAIGSRIFGCDICQDVCPWNGDAAVSDDAAWQPRDALRAPRLLELCRLSDDAWRNVLGGSAMRRAGLKRIRRSLAYAATSLPSKEARAALDALAAHPSAAESPAAEAIRGSRGRAEGRGQRAEERLERGGER